MSTNTVVLGLQMPAQEEYYNVDVFNQNAQKIDNKVGAINTSLTSIDTRLLQIGVELAGKAPIARDHIVVLPVAGWYAGAAPFAWMQSVAVPGLAAQMPPPIAGLLVSGTTAETVKAEEGSFSTLSKLETGANALVAYCLLDKPTIDLQLMLKVVG